METGNFGQQNNFKKSTSSESYNKLYDSSEEFTFNNGEPTMFVDEIPNLIEKGKVLDIGGGDGRNAIYLAEKGLDVEVVDIAEKGLEKLRKFANKKNLEIKTKLADIIVEGIGGDYESIVASFMLQHLSGKQARKLIQEMKDHTKIGGINMVAVFTNTGDFYNENPLTISCYPELGELKKSYQDSGWEIVNYTERQETANQTKEDGTHYENINAYLLARKKEK